MVWNLIRLLLSFLSGSPSRPRARRTFAQLVIEGLEDRTVPSPWPLLAGLDFQVQQPMPLAWGEPIQIKYTITNGDATPPTTENFNVGFYLSADNTIDKSDHLLGGKAVGLTVPPHFASVTATESLTLPTVNPIGGAGPFYIGMIIDPEGKITEVSRAPNSNRGDGLDRAMVSIVTPAGPPGVQSLLNDLNQYSVSRAQSDLGSPMILLNPSVGGG